jgi:hypothetical protein
VVIATALPPPPSNFINVVKIHNFRHFRQRAMVEKMARGAEWQDCFVLLCACAQKVQNKGWQSANRGLWIIS